MPDNLTATAPRIPLGSRVFFTIYAALAALTGAALVFGGGWLLSLGGSPYYLLAGLVTIAAAVLLFRRRPLGVWLVSGLTVVTILWSLWEQGFNGWALIPRLDWLIVMTLLLCVAWPLARRSMLAVRRGPYLLATGVPALAALALIVTPIAAEQGNQLADPSATANAGPLQPAGRTVP